MPDLSPFQQWCADTHPTYGDDSCRRLTTKRKIRFIDLCRPEYYYYPHGIQTAFYAYQWMVRTASACDRSGDRKFRNGLDSLSLASSVGCREAHPFTDDWYDNLKERLWWGVLSRQVPQEWRDENGVRIDGSKIIPVTEWAFPGKEGFTGDSAVRQCIDRLFKFDGCKLRHKHNEFHPKAVRVVYTTLAVLPTSFRFTAHYGYPRPDGCDWKLNWYSADGEPLVDFACRMAALMHNKTVRGVKFDGRGVMRQCATPAVGAASRAEGRGR